MFVSAKKSNCYFIATMRLIFFTGSKSKDVSYTSEPRHDAVENICYISQFQWVQTESDKNQPKTYNAIGNKQPDVICMFPG